MNKETVIKLLEELLNEHKMYIQDCIEEFPGGGIDEQQLLDES